MTQTTVRTILASVAACGLAASAAADVPEYNDLTLILRANGPSAYRLPNSSVSISSQTPTLNNRDDVAIKIIGIGENVDQGPWVGNASGGEIQEVADTISDVWLNNAGVVSYSKGAGIYTYTIATDTIALVTTAPSSTLSSVRINNNGQIGYRAGSSTNGVIGVFTPGSGFVVYAATVTTTLAPPGPYSNIYSPDINDNGQLAARVDLGTTQNSQIRLFGPGGTSTLIASTVGADPTSPYLGFDSTSVSVNNTGWVAFIANRTAAAGGGRGVFLSNGTTTLTIALTSPGGPVTELPAFGAVVNENNLVAFRGFDGASNPSVFVGDGAELVRVAGRTDIVETDLPDPSMPTEPRLAEIANTSQPTVVFSGGIAINDSGDVAFATSLRSLDSLASLGTGLFVASAASTACRADFNASGAVDVADIFSFLSAWFAQAPGSDFNNSGATDVSDIFAFLSAWFAGCP